MGTQHRTIASAIRLVPSASAGVRSSYLRSVIVVAAAVLAFCSAAIAQPGATPAGATPAAPSQAAPSPGAPSQAAPAPETTAVAPPTAAPKDLQQACVAAINADEAFKKAIIRTANEQTAYEHFRVADSIAKNQQHVILAYAAMWLVSAGFLFGLWRRQQRLRAEISRLSGQIAAAENKP